jgi:DHA3 family macrolide efflux protein-like MFS transporter
MAILQATVAPEMQGRVFTIMGSLLWITSPFSLAVAGPVSDRLGLQVWYLVAGVMAVGISAAFVFVPAVRNMEQHTNGWRPEVEPAELAPVEAA